MEKVDIFLGGTCNNSTWRNELMPMLTEANISYFNPVVEDWTLDCQEVEDWHKANDNYNLFVITKEMTGVFSIAEVTDCSNKYPDTTIFYPIYNGFDKGQCKSLKAVAKLVESNGAKVVESFDEIIDFINKNR